MNTPFENYLIEKFDYNPKIDIDNDLKAKETIIKNLDYKFLIPSIKDEDNEILSPLQYNKKFRSRTKKIK